MSGGQGKGSSVSTTLVMLMMVDPGSGRWWWSGPGVGTMRRRGMGRRPARLMYAGFHRRSAVRQEVPRTSLASARGWWHRRAGDRSCSGGAQLGTPGTCWCSVAPKDLSDAAPWPRTSLQTGWSHIGATLGPQTIRSPTRVRNRWLSTRSCSTWAASRWANFSETAQGLQRPCGPTSVRQTSGWGQLQ